MDAFIGLIFIVAIIYGACKLLSSDNQQSDNNTDQTDSSKSQDYYASKSTSDNPPGLSKEEIDRIGNEAKANQHYRVESTKTTGSSPQQPFDTTSDTFKNGTPSVVHSSCIMRLLDDTLYSSPNFFTSHPFSFTTGSPNIS